MCLKSPVNLSQHLGHCLSSISSTPVDIKFDEMHHKDFPTTPIFRFHKREPSPLPPLNLVISKLNLVQPGTFKSKSVGNISVCLLSFSPLTTRL